MRRQFLQFGAFVLLLVCLCAQFAETFDFWDRTLQTGNDVEYSLVLVVLVAGASFGVAHAAAIVMGSVLVMSCRLSPFLTSFQCVMPSVARTGYSPPQPLRI